MGLGDWWRQSREKAALTRQSLAMNDDQGLIAEQVPELVGKTDVEGMAHVLQQIREWKQGCSHDEAATFAARLKASQATWEADGLTMPYWGNLWVLRTYQAELGHHVPCHTSLGRAE